jgi:hypothetical protein
VSDFLELSLKVGDPASQRRLRLVLNVQFQHERLSAWRRVWMTVVAAASVPLGLFAFFPSWTTPAVVRASLALWTAALVGLGASGFREWRSYRRLRDLMATGG